MGLNPENARDPERPEAESDGHSRGAPRTPTPTAIPGEAVGPAPPQGLGREAIRALRVRNFRLLFTGTVLSQTGDFLQIMAQGWLVLLLTGSPLSLGVIGFCQAVPRLALGVAVGALADLFDRRRLLIVAQGGLMAQSIVFAFLVATGRITYPQIIVLTVIAGALNAVGQTARQALLPSLVPREYLMNAIALHSSAFNLTRALGPALGGALVGSLGVAGCLWINAASFLPMLWMLLAMEVRRGNARDSSPGSGLADALQFIRRERDVRLAVALSFAVAFFALSYSRLTPAFARDVFSSGPGGYGLLMSAHGVGAVASTLSLAALGRTRDAPRLLPMLTLLLATSLAGFAVSPNLWVGIACLTILGALQLGQRTMASSLLQARTPDGLRGRVTGLFQMDIGLWSLGTLAMGALAEVSGVRWAVGIGAALCAATAIVALRWARTSPSSPASVPDRRATDRRASSTEA